MKMKLSKLVIANWALELRPIDAVVASRYRQAMRCGVEFPPIIVDRETNEVISGNHRVTAAMAEFGEDGTIEASVRKFASRADALKLMAEENSRHGEPMNGITRRRMVCAMLTEGVAVDDVARIMGFPVRNIERIGGQSVIINQGSRHEVRPVKRGVDCDFVKSMSKADYDAHIKADVGVDVRELARQIARHLKNGWVDLDDEQNVEALKDLKTELDTVLGG